jgi:hypothetical protein
MERASCTRVVRSSCRENGSMVFVFMANFTTRMEWSAKANTKTTFKAGKVKSQKTVLYCSQGK